MDVSVFCLPFLRKYEKGSAISFPPVFSSSPLTQLVRALSFPFPRYGISPLAVPAESFAHVDDVFPPSASTSSASAAQRDAVVPFAEVLHPSQRLLHAEATDAGSAEMGIAGGAGGAWEAKHGPFLPQSTSAAAARASPAQETGEAPRRAGQREEATRQSAAA